MSKQITEHNYDTAINYSQIDAAREIARLQGYRAGYQMGVIDGRGQKLREMLEAPKESHDVWFCCDICGNDFWATNEQAKSSGWIFGKGHEICGDHD